MTKNRFLALAALAIVASACTQKETTTTTTAPPGLVEFNRTYTLQGFVADAVNGTRIGGSDLQLFLIQGDAVRSPTRTNFNAGDALLGEFSFSGIPADYNATNKTYKVVAVKPGYQRFEAEIEFTADVTSAPEAIDAVYNRIGNIYLFPIGATAPAFRFAVTYNGKPVPNATVLLDSAPNGNQPIYNTYHALAAAQGFVPSLSQTTDANGVATFPGSSLALGAAYAYQVLPLTYTEPLSSNQVPLMRFRSTTNLVAGVTNLEQRIVMDDLVASTLYALGASNEPSGQVISSGRLVVTFSAPVTLRNPTGFGATLFGTTTGVLNATTPVAAALSADGKTLTLDPNWAGTATPGVSDRDVWLVYSNGTAFVDPVDYPALDRQLFGDIRLPNNAFVSPTVVLRAP